MLAQDSVSPSDKFLYLAINFGIYASAGYVAVLFVSVPGGWFYWYEGLLVLGVTVVGLVRCRDKYGAAPDDKLLASCLILGVPLGLKLILLTWFISFLVMWGLRWSTLYLGASALAPGSVPRMLFEMAIAGYGFVIAILGNVVYFIRLSEHLATVGSGIQSNAIANGDAEDRS
jgi:hypothetical protein